MHKFLFILMLAVSFVLGIVSQNLIAGNWVTPSYGTPAPVLRTVVKHRGEVYYPVPSDWKVLDTGITSMGNVFVVYRQLK